MEDVTSRAESGGQEEPVGPLLSKRVQTMHTLLTPPIFRGSTAQEKQGFMKKYEAYCRQLSALETAFFRPFQMPVGACVEDERRRLIAMFDIGQNSHEQQTRVGCDAYRCRLMRLKTSTRYVSSAGDRDMEWMIESGPKKIVHYLMDALFPKKFRPTVENEMARESNKPLL
ncbi:hypothetical protein GQ600_9072 [Phytophthora cactorum]|nr:hypothetical protein GQ600_9072 [Phytophthora cactorum]